MKKFILPILLFLMFIPFVANAETCDTDKITINKITIESKSDNVEEISEATVNSKNINLNLSMSNLGDNIEYKIVVKNDSNEDYELDKNNFNISSDYIKYTLESEDDTIIVKANSSKVVYLKVNYENKVPDEAFELGTYNDNKIITLNLSNGNTISMLDTLKNPNTGVQSYILIIFIIMLISITTYVLLKKKEYTKFMILIISSMIVVPISVYAICKCEIKIESKIKINDKSYMPCTFDGNMIQGVEFAYGDFIYHYKQEYYQDESDWNFKWKNINEDGWGVIYKDVGNRNITGELTPRMCSSINGKPIVSMNYTFYYLSRISKFDASYIKTSNVVNMSNAFYYLGGEIVPENVDENNKKVEIIGLENWNVSKVKNMENLFYGVGRFSGDTSITGLSSWDTSNVQDMSGMFLLVSQGIFSISDTTFERQNNKVNISGIENWNVSNVKDMSYMFEDFGSCVKELKLDFSKWNVSKVENFSGMFEDFGYLSDSVKLIGLDNWDVSSGTDFSYMFDAFGAYAKSIVIRDISNWNVSNAKNMTGMFIELGRRRSEHIEFSNLSKWNPVNVEDMSSIFDSFGSEHSNIVDIGTLNVYGSDVSYLFYDTANIKVIVNIYSKDPIYYSTYYSGNTEGNTFKQAATNQDSLIIVNYSNDTTNIDDIIATKSENSNVVKGISLSNN